MNQNSDKYRFPDRKENRKLFIIYGGVILAIVLLIALIAPILSSMFSNLMWQDEMEFKELLFLDLPLLLIIPSAIFLIRTGLTIKAERRFPSSKMNVLRKTLILRGDEAVKKGKRLIILGVFAIFMIVISVISTRFINKRFTDNPFNYVDWSRVEKVLERIKK
jgi:MFS family permease